MLRDADKCGLAPTIRIDSRTDQAQVREIVATAMGRKYLVGTDGPDLTILSLLLARPGAAKRSAWQSIGRTIADVLRPLRHLPSSVLRASARLMSRRSE